VDETGIITAEDFEQVLPAGARTAAGPYAVLECLQEIPCDPCVEACPRGAITIQGNLNELPRIDHELCNGCGLCVAKCPGLAIFVIHPTFSETEALVTMPYEFVPLPRKGEAVDILDREGVRRGRGRVVKVLNTRAQDRTPILSVAVPRELAQQVRFIREIRETGR
jgi:Fe-S-cluster-containing hydrogenase component 2